MKIHLSAPLTEADIKSLVISRLFKTGRIKSTAAIANEYRLGNSGVRADLAILDKKFIGIEVKSERDSLRRLSSQLKSYQFYFDLTILVVAEKHLRNIDIDLAGVELWTISDRGRAKIVKKPEKGCSPSTERDLIDLLPARQRRRIQQMDFCETPGSVSREAFSTYFRDRFGVTSNTFWDLFHLNGFDTPDLDSLSVYKPLRKEAIERAKLRADTFKDWKSRE